MRTTSRTDFNPRSPCGERHGEPAATSDARLFQSTLPLRGATRKIRCGLHLGRISIHAPLAGSDDYSPLLATRQRHFNPRSPCGERRGSFRETYKEVAISIHAPLAGSDAPGYRFRRHPQEISIHAPLAGSDLNSNHDKGGYTYFNPRSPCGERPSPCAVVTRPEAFQSTLPLRGATMSPPQTSPRSAFQSTLPLRGATTREITTGWWDVFQSTLPLRGATFGEIPPPPSFPISIHAPLAGSDDRHPGAAGGGWLNFNPRSPCGERPGGSRHPSWGQNFNPRSPCGERRISCRTWPV